MGQTLGRAAQWTSASDGGQGKLEFTPINEMIVNSIIKFVEAFPGKYPQEAQMAFKKPLEWTTSLKASAFSGGYEQTDDGIKSTALDKDDNPLLVMDGDVLKVSSLEQVNAVLKLADDKKMHEAQCILQANRDPLTNILGDGFASVEGEDSATVRLLEQIQKEEGEAKEEKEAKLKVALIVQQFDTQLMSKSIEEIAKEVRLRPEQVDREVTVLKSFSGEDENCVLDSIVYTSDYVFANGCRAPPWRQVHGEICYLKIKPRDGDGFYVTAATAGVFINKGAEKEGDELDYEREGDIHKDLISLLKLKSEHFAEKIQQKDFVLQEDRKGDDKYVLNGDDDGDYIERKDDRGRDKDDKEEKSEKQKTTKKSKKKNAGQQKLEPSLKWKNLGTASIEEDEKQQKEKKEKKDKKDNREKGKGKKKKVPTATLR